MILQITMVKLKVKMVKVLGSQGWDLMREGEAEKQVNFHIMVKSYPGL